MVFVVQYHHLPKKFKCYKMIIFSNGSVSVFSSRCRVSVFFRYFFQVGSVFAGGLNNLISKLRDRCVNRAYSHLCRYISTILTYIIIWGPGN